MANARRQIQATYQQLHQHYGPQHWLPADSPEEVMIGAVLTQNTSWGNVEKAIANLKQANALDMARLAQLAPAHLAELIRPSGYFNIKAKRLQSLCQWVVEQGGYDRLKRWPTDKLRTELLAVYGVGPETADDIVLYAFNRPSFVIDTYTKRLLSRLGISQATDYHQLQALFHRSLDANAALYNEFHALIVRHAKLACRSKPVCEACVLRRRCWYISEC